MKIRNALPKDFKFILKLTRWNMEKIVTEEWNADWEKDVEPNFVNMWKSPGKKKIIEVGNCRVGYFWFERHPEKKEIFINSIQIEEQFQRKGLGTEVINWLLINCCIHLSCGQKRFPLFERALALKFKPQNLILEP
uniref:N-acetyltransferase domain-containing protein n=1 Tax=Candidatus Methanophagaceae archaeon ANME-1 ERB6 TaxID=2759912 RepID=A0A7G9Z0B7_9EURY|nr:hypothetical protein DJFKIEJF_00065 [Methanosarcinales archaeon ANME-1 ERB6]